MGADEVIWFFGYFGGQAGESSMFRGHESGLNKNECVLIYDEDTGVCLAHAESLRYFRADCLLCVL